MGADAGGHVHGHGSGPDALLSEPDIDATTGTGASATTPAASTAPTRATVLAQIAADNAYISGTLMTNMAAHSDPVVKNTAAYCQGTSTANRRARVVLSPITPTHDSSTRVTAAGKNPAREKAWCWGTTYADGSNAGVHIYTNLLGGLHSGNRIGLVVTRSHNPRTSFDEAATIRFLVHEVQHDADHHGGITEPVPSGGDRANWTWFKTEFRSYWVDGGRASLDATNGPAQTATVSIGGNNVTISATNARSLAIKRHILGGSAYARIATAYAGNASLKTQIDGHNQPDGANLTNDPKVDDFLRSVRGRNANRARTAWGAMNTAQKTTLRGNDQARALITSTFDTRSRHRLPLLGFIDGRFDTRDHQNAAYFLEMVTDGNRVGTRIAPSIMSSVSKTFVRGHADFRPFGDHWTSAGSGHWMYAMEYNTNDLIGLTAGYLPRFVKQYADVRSEITGAACSYIAEVKDGSYPESKHQF